jgi:hypothetical protein
VEFALRAGDIPRAIHCTVGCFESALWDHLDPKLKRHPTRERLFSVSPVPDISLISNDSIPEDEKRKRPFELKIDEAKEGGPWYKLHDDNMGSVVLAKGYLHKPRLEALGKAVAKIRDLRNDVAHNAPTPEKMERAEKEMQKANLWSSDNHFLCQPLVIDTLEELGEINPRRLAEDLVSVIERRLLDSAAFLEK